jgi:hypothetical protein
MNTLNYELKDCTYKSDVCEITIPDGIWSVAKLDMVSVSDVDGNIFYDLRTEDFQQLETQGKATLIPD